MADEVLASLKLDGVAVGFRSAVLHQNDDDPLMDWKVDIEGMADAERAVDMVTGESLELEMESSSGARYRGNAHFSFATPGGDARLYNDDMLESV